MKAALFKLIPLLVFLNFSLLHFARCADASQNASLTAACTKLAGFMAKSGKKKLAVMDITGVDGRSTELGKAIAEDIIVELFATDKMGFVVVDRSNLNRLLEEQKRASEGALKFDDAKQLKELGRLTGADAFLFGSIAEVGEQFQVTLKIIATDSAEVVGAARMSVTRSDDMRVLNQNGSPNTGTVTRGKSSSDKRFTAKKTLWTEGALEAALTNFVVSKEGDVVATIKLRNLSKNQTLHICSNATTSRSPVQTLTVLRDSGGSKFILDGQDGLIAYAGSPSGYQTLLNELHFNQTSTLERLPQIGAGQEIMVTARFKEEVSGELSARENSYRLSLELIYLFSSGRPKGTPRNGMVVFDEIRPH